MTMLADHPTWPKKKTELIVEEAIITPPQGQSIPPPPPFPPQPTNQGIGGYPNSVSCKPCPFCGGVMSTVFIPTQAPTLGSMGGAALGRAAQVQVGCHNTGCGMSPKFTCYPSDIALVMSMWNTRSP